MGDSTTPPSSAHRGAQPTRPSDSAFVVGCARSGTSILGELIASHPTVKYVFEAHEIWERAGSGEGDSHRLTAAYASPAVIRSIRDWFELERGSARLLVEKNPRNSLRIPFLRAVFPEAKIIHIVRDGRDTACSLLPGIGGAEWMHLKPPRWKEWMNGHSGVVRCALAWQEVVEIALSDLETVPHLRVKYENLVVDPFGVATALQDYLGLSPDPAMTAFCRRISNRTEGSYHAQVQTMWFRPDHVLRAGRWREYREQAPGEKEQVEELLRPTLTRLGYA